MKADILGIKVDTYSMHDTVVNISQAINKQKMLRVVTANPEMIYASGFDQRLKDIINSADIITADGTGVVWAAKLLKTPVEERVTGIDLVQALFPAAESGKWRVFFLGGKPGVAEQAVSKICRQYPSINWGLENGYFTSQDESKVLEKIMDFQPDMLLVGLGSPRQEYWLVEHPGLAKVSIGVGGSFDALAGLVKRAPLRIQKLRLEWLYRLWKEPWRWRRQLVLPRFVLKVVWQRVVEKKTN